MLFGVPGGFQSSRRDDAAVVACLSPNLLALTVVFGFCKFPWDLKPELSLGSPLVGRRPLLPFPTLLRGFPWRHVPGFTLEQRREAK